MKRLALCSLLGVLCFLSILYIAHADTPTTTLLPGVRADYRFDYLGDGSQIKVALDGADPNAVTLSIYTPAQLEAVRRGETVTPIGRGMPSRDHSLFWAGGFKVPGVYHAFVENRSAAPITYRMDISGDGVSGAPRTP